MIKRIAGLCSLTLGLLGTALAQSTLEYGLYRAVTVAQQTSFKRVVEGRVGERLNWMGQLSVQQDVTDVLTIIPVPDGTLYAGGLQIPAGTVVGFSVNGQTFGPIATARTRFVRARLPLARLGQKYTIQFQVQVTAQYPGEDAPPYPSMRPLKVAAP